MCGIFALINDTFGFSSDFINEQFLKGQRRGPEFSKLKVVSMKATFGFHRLAINGLNNESNQPMEIGDITLICNGEIYNYKELYSMMNVEPSTDSDCEVIIHLYKKYGMDHTLQLLDGVFSFLLLDNKYDIIGNKLYVARDPYGVRPLYVLKPTNMITTNSANITGTINNVNNNKMIGFASELKCLSEFQNIKNEYVLEQFEPGTYSLYTLPCKSICDWTLENENVRYHTTGFTSHMFQPFEFEQMELEYIYSKIQYYLSCAVNKRCMTTERPIACLLSGGLDSSLITALVNEYIKSQNSFLQEQQQIVLETYSIGLLDSEDLKYARIVANYLGTKHTEIICSEEDFLNAIPDVIYAIESYDTTTIRASIGNYLLGKYISENSNANVIFNGDGSDELCGGYLYMHKCPDSLEFDKECRRLLKDIHKFDVLRSDKCMSSHGLEPRTPFLDREWVQYYLSINPSIRHHSNIQKSQSQCEKFLLRSAFSPSYFLNIDNKPLLPDSVVWRTKEAFSDGVSKTSRSLYQIIQEHVASCQYEYINNYIVTTGVLPETDEQLYYRKIFDEHYTNSAANILDYFWMPKYVRGVKDASARTLNIYKSSHVISSA